MQNLLSWAVCSKGLKEILRENPAHQEDTSAPILDGDHASEKLKHPSAQQLLALFVGVNLRGSLEREAWGSVSGMEQVEVRSKESRGCHMSGA